MCTEEQSQCNDQCMNDGECFSVFGGVVCSCEEPAYGDYCENVHDVCNTENPCVYGGDCSLDDNQIVCSNCDEGKGCLLIWIVARM